MAYPAEESSPVAYVSDPCCICDEQFESDLELTNHLIDHASEEHFKNAVAEKEKSVKTPVRPVHGVRAIPEFTKTSFVREPPLRKKTLNVSSTPSEPEVYEILSSDEEQEPDAKKQKTSFRLVTPVPKQTSPANQSVGPPFRCHSCSLVLNDATAFREHLLTHDKPRPYVCHICKKSFAYKGTLRQHLHLHISEKAHECKVCHKKFSIKSLLRKHEETHEMPQSQEQKSS